MLVWNHVAQDGLPTPASAFQVVELRLAFAQMHLDLLGQRFETHWMPVEVEFYKEPNKHSIPTRDQNF